MKIYIVAALVVLASGISAAFSAQQGAANASPTLDTAAIAGAMGRAGVMMQGDVYRLSLPRLDLHVTVGDVVIKPGSALNTA